MDLIANTKQDAGETVQSFIDRQIKIYQDHEPHRANLSEQVAENAIVKGFKSRVQKNIDQRSLDIMSIVELREVARKAELYVNKYKQQSPMVSTPTSQQGDSKPAATRQGWNPKRSCRTCQGNHHTWDCRDRCAVCFKTGHLAKTGPDYKKYMVDKKAYRDKQNSRDVDARKRAAKEVKKKSALKSTERSNQAKAPPAEESASSEAPSGNESSSAEMSSPADDKTSAEDSTASSASDRRSTAMSSLVSLTVAAHPLRSRRL
ncbi:hypothetical protein HDE_02610 [Halotydeus destructor]|nr:hypothetical protein HDE_02610 [Halotydeus destructor]